jgi:hypothetical protein
MELNAGSSKSSFRMIFLIYAAAGVYCRHNSIQSLFIGIIATIRHFYVKTEGQISNPIQKE